MAKLTITFPEKIAFTTAVYVRMNDINHRNHVSAIAFGYLLEEARMKFLQQFGYDDRQIAGQGVVFGNLQIIYTSEILFGEEIMADITPIDFHKYGFDFVYRLYEKNTKRLCALAQNSMLFFDFEQQQIALMPSEVHPLFEKSFA